MIRLATLILELLAEVHAWFAPNPQKIRAEIHEAVAVSKDGDTSAIEKAIERNVMR